MAKKVVVEEKGGGVEFGSGRWMLTYLDMVALSFGVFVRMYAMRSQSKAKFEVVAESLRVAFMGETGADLVGAGRGVFDGGELAAPTTSKDGRELKPPRQTEKFKKALDVLQQEIRSKKVR